MIGCIQATLLEANEEVVALAEQSRRRECVIVEKDEKIRTQHLEHCNMERFLRSSIEETGTKFRSLVTEYDCARGEWRSMECGYTEKISELEIRLKTLKDELRNSKHKMAEYEAERHRLQCTVKEAEQELCRVKTSNQAERSQLECSKREYKKRIDELTSELDGLKKYVDCQERKCCELEDRLTRSESQLDGAVRCKMAAEREMAEQCALQQSSLHDITRSLRCEYDAKLAENDKKYRYEIEKINKSTNRRTEHEMEKIREEIRCDFEEKIARLKVEYKLKESNYERQVARMVDKMRQYECKLEGIVRDKERERTDVYTRDPCRRSSPPARCKSDWRDTYEKYSGNSKWRTEHGGSRLGDSTSRTLNNPKKLLDDNGASSSRRFVIHGTYTPRRSSRRDDCSSLTRIDYKQRSRSMRKSLFP
ncbi:hypothetical protein BV898_08864 [Hypsibius exemplaris]|uniref:Uncharacterized protein n=1 Tax=Hypsibius exemplaris TaxID=2072580 RepID=A0A1W0WP95_HYPEX|nr:hypothetical protein BV898_08864 [Hypsibius exemplaris]